MLEHRWAADQHSSFISSRSIGICFRDSLELDLYNSFCHGIYWKIFCQLSSLIVEFGGWIQLPVEVIKTGVFCWKTPYYCDLFGGVYEILL